MDAAKDDDDAMMNPRDAYLREVYPKLDLPLADQYPLASLVPREGMRPLGAQPLLMLVALTGTGKSTTLDILRARYGDLATGAIPSRRELADWVAIPLAQALANQPIAPINDRALRFAATRRFAEWAPGGMAEAFSWLHLADDFKGIPLSEGIRGPYEIGYALRSFPRWRIVELTLNPLTRLRRLSGRRDAFDQVAGAVDVSFLPRELQAEAKSLVKAGEITAKALAIVKAEAANYGFDPFADGREFANYHRIAVDNRSPDEVAAAVTRIIEDQFADARKREKCRK